jgi:hypothetical protein
VVGWLARQHRILDDLHRPAQRQQAAHRLPDADMALHPGHQPLAALGTQLLQQGRERRLLGASERHLLEAQQPAPRCDGGLELSGDAGDGRSQPARVLLAHHQRHVQSPGELDQREDVALAGGERLRIHGAGQLDLHIDDQQRGAGWIHAQLGTA